MSKLYNRNYNSQANKIRTLLLICSNNEISKNKKCQQSNFLLNSKELETYETSFENFIILEHDNISCHEIQNNLSNNDTINDFFFQYNKKEISPIEIKQKKKVLNKHPERLSPNKSVDSNENLIKKSKTKKEEIYNNYKYLKYLCNHFKSSIKIEYKRRNSVILRRKKYIKSENNNLISPIIINKNENKKKEIMEKEKKINQDNEVIILHKIERNKKSKHSTTKKTTKNYFKRYSLNIVHDENGLFSIRKENNLNLVFNG